MVAARSSASAACRTPTPRAARCCRRRRTPTSPSWPGARSGRLIGHLTGLLATLKGLPLAYNRDLQEDKEPLFDALDQVGLGLAALTGLLAEVSFDTDRMAAAADDPAAAATDLAEYLVRAGVPFREAHAVVGDLVRRSIDDGEDLAALVATAPGLGSDAAALLEPGVSVTRRTSRGGGGPAPYSLQREAFAARLAEDHARR